MSMHPNQTLRRETGSAMAQIMTVASFVKIERADPSVADSLRRDVQCKTDAILAELGLLGADLADMSWKHLRGMLVLTCKRVLADLGEMT